MMQHLTALQQTVQYQTNIGFFTQLLPVLGVVRIRPLQLHTITDMYANAY